jgi:lysine 2,3-aminomutase
VLPDHIAQSQRLCHQHIRTRKDFIQDVTEGLKLAPMALKLTPHILSRINWRSPLDDPIRRQFLPLKSGILPDHPELTLDSLHEEEDSGKSKLSFGAFIVQPILIYGSRSRAGTSISRQSVISKCVINPFIILFVTNCSKATSICPVYCRFCTRAYSVGANTELVTKFPQKPSLTRWEKVFEYIQNHESIQDIVISGGDSYQLTSDQIQMMGKRLLDIPHVRRFRIATRGLAFAPGRILDPTDSWSNAVIAISQRGRKMGKQVCIHTHFDHPDEITWITRKAANKLFEAGVIVRNQSVLLKGVNDDNETMGKLIKELADINIQPVSTPAPTSARFSPR